MELLEEIKRKKTYLNQYQNAVKREKKIIDEINRLRMDRSFLSNFFDSMACGTDIKDLSDYIVLLDAEINKLKLERLEKIKRYRDIETRIKDICNEDEQETLRLYYITGLTWEKVADEMGFTCRHIMRIHNAALKNLKLS